MSRENESEITRNLNDTTETPSKLTKNNNQTAPKANDNIENESASPVTLRNKAADAIDNISMTSSDTRYISGMKTKRIVSTSPSVYLTPSGVNSTSDFHNYRHPKNGIKKSDSMVLTFVVPTNQSNSTSPNLSYKYAECNRPEEMPGNDSFKGMHAWSIGGHQDMNGGLINRAFSAGDLTEYPNMIPQYKREFSSNSRATTPRVDNPTPSEDKKKASLDMLINTSSILYALFIVTVGLAVYVADIVDGSHRTAELFSLVIVSISFAYIIILISDISIFASRKRKYEKELEKYSSQDNMNVTATPEGGFQFDVVLPQIINKGIAIKHDYCFINDRHSKNFFLKVGASAFCFVHLIHGILLFGYQVLFFSANENRFYDCASIPTLILDILYPVYSFFMLYFIFKYSNLVINKRALLARFAIMHCLASSICFWIWTIIRETIEAIHSSSSDYENSSTISPEYSEELMQMNGSISSRASNDLTFRRFTKRCDYEDSNTLYKLISPYLYPFSVEYSILVVGVLYLLWQNIQKCYVEDANDESSVLPCKNPTGNADNEESNVAIHADCQGSNKGLFAGFVVLVVTVVSCILFFIAIYVENANSELGAFINDLTSTSMYCVMLIACIFGYRQILKLDLNTAHHNLLDDVLLFICIPGFFLNGVFSIIPAIINAEVLSIVSIILEVVQVTIQTAFLLDGVRRSSNTKRLRRSKPGRELVTFLILANIALWILHTFEVKAHGLVDHRYEFYGKVLWTILGHMCLPLRMFYRFHSAVCFGDVWKYAYEPSGH